MPPDVYEESRATVLAANLPHWLLLMASGYSDVTDPTKLFRLTTD